MTHRAPNGDDGLQHGETVRIECALVGDRNEVPIRSGAIERELGEALRPDAARVDLSNPEVTLFVEVDPDRAYYFVANERGAGGLPLGTEGRAVSLLSGGFDSPVASWRLLRRGNYGNQSTSR